MVNQHITDENAPFTQRDQIVYPVLNRISLLIVYLYGRNVIRTRSRQPKLKSKDNKDLYNFFYICSGCLDAICTRFINAAIFMHD